METWYRRRYKCICWVPEHPVRRALNREMQRKRNWAGLLRLHERKCRLHTFVRIAPKLTDAEYWEYLRFVWEDSETIFQYQLLWAMLLSSNRGQRESFMDAEEREFLAALPERFTVFRGYWPECGNENGLSWTLNRDIAIRLGSRRWSNVPGLDKPLRSKNACEVAERSVGKVEVFAYLNSRGEEEIILVPNTRVAP